MSGYCAVIDIGKTNKKVFVYDRHLQCVHSLQATFEEFEKEGVILEDIDGIDAWVWNALKEVTARFEIQAVSVTTHGATGVCIDGEGRNVVPLVAYTHEPGEEFHRAFFDEFGDARTLQQTTCTANFSNLINLGKGIRFRQEQFPEAMQQVKHILNFPQYFGFLLTGIAAAEPTATGCHTYLYDFTTRDWSSVAEKMGIKSLLPDNMLKPWDILGTVSPTAAARTGLSEECLVTVGIHDSNSSLLPYLIKGAKDFVLDSTGTWCVAMRPAKDTAFAAEELGSCVFYNLSAFNQPVKTTIVPAGMEFEAYTDLFRKIYTNFAVMPFDPGLTQTVLTQQKLFIAPGVLPGMGMFPQSTMRIIENGQTLDPARCRAEDLQAGPEELFAALNLSLAIQTKIGLERAGARDGTAIYIEGGFRKNDSYARLLGALFPASDISFTNIEEATSFGAALLGCAALEGCDPMGLAGAVDIHYEPAAKTALQDLDEYSAGYLKAVNSGKA
ncbi:FGGY-family carbohydrate kinase [Planctomycetota bacterium]